MSVNFNHLISLGSDCDVALQLRRHGWLNTRSVFDWLITPWNSMMSVLSDDGIRLAHNFVPSHGGRGVGCAEYGLVYWHEFPRGPDQMAIFSTAQAERTRGKLAHKMALMRAACSDGSCVLFVRSGIVTDAPGDRFADGAVFSGRELDRCAALIQARHPDLRFSILMILYDGRDELAAPLPTDPRVSLHRMSLSGGVAAGHMTKASDADWDSLLDRVPYEKGTGPGQPPEQLSA